MGWCQGFEIRAEIPSPSLPCPRTVLENGPGLTPSAVKPRIPRLRRIFFANPNAKLIDISITFKIFKLYRHLFDVYAKVLEQSLNVLDPSK